MPIYAYRCADCGHAKDVLQKMSDPPLTVCPSCGAAAFSKQVTAAGFQLKGSGWYATDFKGGNNAGKKSDTAGDKPSESAVAKPAGDSAAAGTPAPTAAPAAAGAGGSGSPPSTGSSPASH